MTDFPNGCARVLAGVAIMGRDLAEADYAGAQMGHFDPLKSPDEIAEYADGYVSCEAAVHKAVIMAKEAEVELMVAVACAAYRQISMQAYGFAPPTKTVGNNPGNIVPIKGGRA